MQPFSVTCETCHARLKVLSESAIGQIVSCPQCGSMVEIAPPVEWSAASAAPATAGFEPQPLPQPPQTFIERLTQPMALLVGASCMVVAATVTMVLLARGSAEETIEPQAAHLAEVDAAAPITSQTSSAPPEAIDKNETNEANEAEVDTASESVAAEPAPSSLPPASPAIQTEAVAAGAKQNETQPSEPDPLGFNPGAFDVDVPDEVEPAAQSSETEPRELEAAKAAKTQAGGLAAGSSLLDSQTAIRLGPMSSDGIRARDPKAQLALPIESYEVSQVPLVQLLESLSDMAAVPITLDPSALAMAGIAANQPVTLRAQQTTLAGALGDALARHGLAYKIEDGQVIVVKAGAERRRSVDYELKDLVGQGSSDASALAKLIQQTVAPDSWHSAGGSGTIAVEGTSLAVDQDGRVHNQILMFCERLRIARGLPTRSRYPTERLTVAPLYVQLKQRLDSPATFTFLPWTPLADVFRHWQEVAGVTVLVDWSALAQQELGPATPVTSSIVDQPWTEALETILTPLGLTWWAVDGQTIEITSREAAQRVRQVEFYPVDPQILDQYPSPAALVAELERGLAARASAAQGDSPPWFLSFDEPSGRLIAVGLPDVHRRLASKLTSLGPQTPEGQPAPKQRKPIFVDEGP